MFVLFCPWARRKKNKKSVIFSQGIADFFYSTKYRRVLHIFPHSGNIPENAKHRGGQTPSPMSFFKLIWRCSVGCRSPPVLFQKIKNFNERGLENEANSKGAAGRYYAAYIPR